MEGNTLRIRPNDISQEALDAMDEAKQIEHQYKMASSGKNSLSSSLNGDKMPMKFQSSN
jgi:hypothetical protein